MNLIQKIKRYESDVKKDNSFSEGRIGGLLLGLDPLSRSHGKTDHNYTIKATTIEKNFAL
ncbi:hypothetical protein BpHYR1_051419 [Brachionus plicatilis]|uniref:Uncharacterized protein n=1 Tax=Brachionus plicatilis TaxID=10195 RepID=A0A3M7S2N8_BRAPC|nr:hypothetical protein BpHYR1_051419 [Brachionus plicatilis]